MKRFMNLYFLSNAFIIIRGFLNRQITVLTLAVVLLSFGVTSISYADNKDQPHFHGRNRTRSVAENKQYKLVGDPVSAHSLGSHHRYVLGGTDAESFEIDENDGQLKTSVRLNYEVKSSYTVTVTIQSGSLNQQSEIDYTDRGSVTVTIDVDDRNDPPAFSEGHPAIRYIDEHSPAGVNIGEPFIATDEDGDSLEYYPVVYGAFAELDYLVNLDGDTGQLTTGTDGGFDYEGRSTFILNISAYDGNGGSGQQRVEIRVNDLVEIEIPDTNLRAAIQKAFNITNGRTPTENEMLTLTSLTATRSDISTLSGLQFAENLETLSIWVNDISDGELQYVSELENLKTLLLGDNNITDISELAELTKLEKLGLANNSIEAIPVSNAGNSIFENFTNLTSLRLDGNQISDISSLSVLTGLTHLYLSGNPIEDFSALAGMTVLTDFDLTWVSDENLASAIRTKLGLAKDTVLTPERLAELTSLNAIQSKITSLEGLEYATNLEKLIIWGNNITSDQMTYLSGLTALKRLNLGDNEISDFSDLLNLTSLEMLGLAGNGGITDITGLSSLSNLKRLILRRTSIKDIEEISQLTSLETLHLQDNISMSDITPLAGLVKLKELNLSGNEISDVSALRDLVNLEALYVSAKFVNTNKISDVSALSGLIKLKHLSLGSHSISDVAPLYGLVNLISLDLKDNSIADVSPLRELVGLEKLFIAGNPILDTSPLYPLTQQDPPVAIDITVSQYALWDVNEDGSVDATDSALVMAAIGQSGEDIVNLRTDVNGDDTVDNADLTLVTENFDTVENAAPAARSSITNLLDAATLASLDRDVLQAELEILRAESDGSAKYRNAIALLEAVLAATRPEETLLLANYPNPFNPETWLPYHLANASDVRITIYDARGSVVRRLELGHQTAGYYTSRSRAAYWDGKNAIGESVASGIYFYQLEADNMSFLRKMLILK